MSTAAAQPLRSAVLIACLAATLFLLRLSAPSNLLDQDQENPATYVLDALKNGNWICQRDLSGNITSKPPLFTWLAAVASLAVGRVGLFSLYLPGALALWGSAWLAFCFGRKHFGERAGWFAALGCMLCTAGLKQFGLARTDAVFAFTVSAAALLAYRAWTREGGWTWFWLLGAAATLTKGPLGVVLAAGGLLASAWEWRTDKPLNIRGRQWPGLLLFILITAGWLGLAYWQLGWPIIDKLFVQELLFHAVEGEHKTFPGSLFYLSSLYYLGRAAPWSLFAALGLWRIARHPAVDSEERRFERFLFCWFMTGLALFSLSPHQRGDLLWPLLPAGALVAGREVARLTARLRPTHVQRGTVAVVILAVAAFAYHYFGPHARHPLVRQTVALEGLAGHLEQHYGREFPLTHTDDPPGLQVYLNTYRPPVSMRRAAALLRGPDAVFVAVSDLRALATERTGADPAFYILCQDHGPVAKLGVKILSNRPMFDTTAQTAFGLGPWLIRFRGDLVHASLDRLTVASGTSPNWLWIRNEGSVERAIHLTIGRASGASDVLNQSIEPGAEFTRGSATASPTL